MADNPSYAAVPIVGTGLAPATADTSLTAPANATTLTFSTAIGASGARIEELRVMGVGSTAVGLVNVFLYDGSTYHFIDSFLTVAVTVTTTNPPYYVCRRYQNLWVPNGWSLRFTVSISTLQSLIKLVAMGANL